MSEDSARKIRFQSAVFADVSDFLPGGMVPAGASYVIVVKSITDLVANSKAAAFRFADQAEALERMRMTVCFDSNLRQADPDDPLDRAWDRTDASPGHYRVMDLSELRGNSGFYERELPGMDIE